MLYCKCVFFTDTKTKGEKEKEAGDYEVISSVEAHKDHPYEKIRTYTLGSIHDVEFEVDDEPEIEEVFTTSCFPVSFLVIFPDPTVPFRYPLIHQIISLLDSI